MKNIGKITKWIFGILIGILTIAMIWLSQSQVLYLKNDTGVDFQKSNLWPQDSIQQIQEYLATTQNLDAFIALHQGREIFSYGDTKQLINLHSARKPIMSLLIGIAKDKGLLHLDETLQSLKINEYGVELTEQESSATIRDLLMARSGVYLPADAQPNMEIEPPKRGQYKPGEYYYYNNFDFNVLGTILKNKTGMSYEECLYQWLALPLEMQEFNPKNVVYGTPFSKIKTQHPAYKTWMSTRDFAKIGTMMAQKGIWKGKRIVSEAWLKESTTPYHFFSETDKKWPKDAYAYLWAVDNENGNIWGTGYGGQMLMVDTTNQLVLVQRHYTGNSLLSQGRYIMNNTQGTQLDLMNVWYALLRCKPE